METLVSCCNLECRLGGHAVLRGVSMELGVGKSLALVGGSGSGKSTLLRIIAGLEVPQRGEVVLNGELVTKNGRILVPPHRRNVAMLFQDGALWPNLSVAENVHLGLAGQRLSRAESQERTRDVLNRCSLAELSNRLPRTLSGGQQQRAALARALAVQPRLVLLDEPFGGLDLLTKKSVADEVVSLRRELGFALILVTHAPWEIEALCERLAVLEGGRISQCGTLRELAASPHTDLARAILRETHNGNCAAPSSPGT